MKRSLQFAVCAAVWAILPMVMGAEGSSSPYSDAIGDIDPGITTANGTLDIVGMEVSNDATNINFKLTVNGDVTNPNWAKYMIGIATGKTQGMLDGNGWNRRVNIGTELEPNFVSNINLSYDNDPFATSIIGMDYWIGSWVDGGGSGQFWTWNGGSTGGGTGGQWAIGPLGSFGFTAGPQSVMNYSVPLSSMNLIPGNVIYFDAYSSGGGDNDSAIDALANPNVSVTGWGGPYTSYATAAGGPGLNQYSVLPVTTYFNIPTGTTKTQGQAGYPALTPDNSPGVTKTGGGTLIFDVANTYTGTTSVQQGTLLLAHADAISESPTFVRPGGNLVINPSITPRAVGITVSGGTLSARSLIISDADAIGILDITAGRVTSAAGSIGAEPGRIGMAIISSGTWTNSGNLEVGVSGPGTLKIFGGLLAIGGTLSYGSSGTIELNPGGALQIGNGGTTGVLGVSALMNSGTLIFNRVDSSVFAGVVSGSGSISKQGTGILALTNESTLSGSTIIQQGTLQLAHPTALASSRIVPLTGGTLTLQQGIRTSVGGLSPNAGGLVDVGTGSITVATGLVQADLVTALKSGRGDGSWTGTSGITSSVVAAEMEAGLGRAIGWRAQADGSMTIAYAAHGDSNLDGRITQTDINLIVTGGKFGQGSLSNAVWAQGDFNYSGGVTQADINLLVGAGLFGQGNYLPPMASAFGDADPVVAVPEPATVGLVGVGLGFLGLGVLRRKRVA